MSQITTPQPKALIVPATARGTLRPTPWGDEANVIVQSAADLPDIRRMGGDTYLDVETTSGTRTRGGLKPYHGDRICGFSFTVGDHPRSYYVPMRHKACTGLFTQGTQNFPLEQARAVLRELTRAGRTWVNHNVTFDAHFVAAEGVEPECDFRCTMSMAKLVDMQSRMSGYGLKPLTRDWLGLETRRKGELTKTLAVIKSQDFGDVDALELGGYCNDDVLMNRELDREIARRRYPDDGRVWRLECEFTRAIFRIERRGLKIDVDRLAEARRKSEGELAVLESRLIELGFRGVNFGSPDQVRDLVINDLKLPIVAWTGEEDGQGEASMGAAAIDLYRELPAVKENEVLRALFGTHPKTDRGLLDKYRERDQFLKMYARGWLEWIDANGYIHPSYNQMVRTGRLSCSQPNVQQNNDEANQYVIPEAGNAFLKRDYSQLEYRVIAGITKEPKLVQAYRDDPTADFHLVVAGLCGIERKPAKSINFGIAFGLGVNGLIAALMKELGGGPDSKARAEYILYQYNTMFPRIKFVANFAKERARLNGYIRTLLGRRRAIDPGWERIGFNTAVQGTAADIAKLRLVAVENDADLHALGVTQRAMIHDAYLLEGPADEVERPETGTRVDSLLCQCPEIDLGVPLMVDGGTSRVSWADCG